MRNYEDTFKTRKESFISAFSICMAVPLNMNLQIKYTMTSFSHYPPANLHSANTPGILRAGWVVALIFLRFSNSCIYCDIQKQSSGSVL